MMIRSLCRNMQCWSIKLEHAKCATYALRDRDMLADRWKYSIINTPCNTADVHFTKTPDEYEDSKEHFKNVPHHHRVHGPVNVYDVHTIFFTNLTMKPNPTKTSEWAFSDSFLASMSHASFTVHCRVSVWFFFALWSGHTRCHSMPYGPAF